MLKCKQMLTFLTFMSRITYMLSRFEHEKCCITSVPNDFIHEPRHEISNNVVCATNKGSDQPVHTLIIAFASRLNII